MPPERRIYLLDPQKHKPEVIAVSFAKTSRSPQNFDEIVNELTDEKSAEFHEKWVVGYGHSSVAEHAVLHIAVENISRLAVEMLESNRLASYTEKSTRYQKWGSDSFYIPAELNQHPLLPDYVETCRLLFDTYNRALVEVRKVVQTENPPTADESEAAWDRRHRSEYVDVCRYLLPAASLANVGMTINARALEHAIQKMLSSALEEVCCMGETIKQVARNEVPTLVKYADKAPYLQEAEEKLSQLNQSLPGSPQRIEDWCQLMPVQPDQELHILAACLYRYGRAGYAQCLDWVNQMSLSDRQQLVSAILSGQSNHTAPLREIEHADFTFDITLDQGAYFELKRHRMMTQSPQCLNPSLGYATPRRMSLAGMEDDFCHAMDKARNMYERMESWNPAVASYIIPNAYNRRVLLTTNLRSLMHLVQLRSADGAHFAIRRIAQRMAEQTRQVMPLFAGFIKTNPNETWQNIEDNYFTSTNSR